MLKSLDQQDIITLSIMPSLDPHSNKPVSASTADDGNDKHIKQELKEVHDEEELLDKFPLKRLALRKSTQLHLIWFLILHLEFLCPKKAWKVFKLLSCFVLPGLKSIWLLPTARSFVDYFCGHLGHHGVWHIHTLCHLKFQYALTLDHS